eukprot:GHVU01114749.1.p1 GENE.GHVU01114749.1~~GHVU01114749.1.p1  ORF type:complete len:184 (+),score=19.02 GHVU01114749.1:40-591(+)
MDNSIKANTKIRILSEEHARYVQGLAKEAGFSPYRRDMTPNRQWVYSHPDMKFTANESYAPGPEEIFIDLPDNKPADEDIELLNNYDKRKENEETNSVTKPNHYQLLPEYEVKDVNKALLDKIEESEFDLSLYEAGWYQQSMQYFMRFYAKNGLEDLEKGVQTMQFVIDSIKAKKNEQSARRN